MRHGTGWYQSSVPLPKPWGTLRQTVNQSGDISAPSHETLRRRLLSPHILAAPLHGSCPVVSSVSRYIRSCLDRHRFLRWQGANDRSAADRQMGFGAAWYSGLLSRSRQRAAVPGCLQIFVFFAEEAKVGVKSIKTYAERMRNEAVSRAVMVVQVRALCCAHQP